MKTNLKKEIPYLLLIAAPLTYLTIKIPSIGEKVAVHFNASGEVDRYGSKTELILVCIFLPLFIYGLMLVLPKLDPKGKLKNMGKKYDHLKLALVTFAVLLDFLIIQSAVNGKLGNPHLTLSLVGLLFAFLGNYFQTVKPNYFIGIRTPWTLENETNWKETHLLAGKIWFVGGILMMIIPFIFSPVITSKIFIGIVTILVIIPISHSFILHRKLKNQLDE
jgi:uncharacterized membrane protein